jgi:hypothetical protein
MTGPELLGDVAVILGPLVGVADHQLDRRAGRDTPSNTPDRISTSSASRRWVVYLFCPGLRRSSQCWMAAASTGTPGGHAVDRRAQRRPVAFAPGGDAEEMAEGVEGHGFLSVRASGLSARGANAKPFAPCPHRGAAYL